MFNVCERDPGTHKKNTFFNLTDILDCFSKDILGGVAQLAEDLVSYKMLQPLEEHKRDMEVQVRNFGTQ